jgi:aldose 1-epimerase
VTYKLTDANELRITYYAVSDKDTVINLTNHAYFNLAGHGAGNVSEHILRLDSPFYLPSKYGMPTGEILSVAGTRFDYRAPRRIGSEPLDNCCVLPGEGFREIAEVSEPVSGRTMTVWTDLPAVQLYNACNMFPGTPGKDGAAYSPGCALCLETQFVPNAVNMPWLNQPVFAANQAFESTTVYAFGITQ